MPRLTKQDHLQLARLIMNYHKKHGFPPSVREIQAGMQLSSSSVVHLRLGRLEALGLLERRPGAARGIRVDPHKVERYNREA